VRRGERDAGRSSHRRALAFAAGAGVIVWLPAIIDLVTGGDNLRRLASYSRQPGERTAGWNAAFSTLGAELRPFGPWISGHDTSSIGFVIPSAAWPGVLTLAAEVLSGLFAWRRGHHDAARLALVAFVATGLAVVATSRVTGMFVPYVVHWWWAVAAIAVLSISWCLVSELRTPRARDVASAVALIGLLATVAVMLRDLPVTAPDERVSMTIEAIGPPTAAALDQHQRYLVRGIDPKRGEALMTGLYVELERRGFDVFVDPDQYSSLRYGTWREARPQNVDAMVMVIDRPDVQIGTWRPPSGSHLVASYESLGDGYVVYVTTPPPA
jgi:hypothetical protein